MTAMWAQITSYVATPITTTNNTLIVPFAKSHIILTRMQAFIGLRFITPIHKRVSCSIWKRNDENASFYTRENRNIPKWNLYQNTDDMLNDEQFNKLTVKPYKQQQRPLTMQWFSFYCMRILYIFHSETIYHERISLRCTIKISIFLCALVFVRDFLVCYQFHWIVSCLVAIFKFFVVVQSWLDVVWCELWGNWNGNWWMYSATTTLHCIWTIEHDFISSWLLVSLHSTLHQLDSFDNFLLIFEAIFHLEREMESSNYVIKVNVTLIVYIVAWSIAHFHLDY